MPSGVWISSDLHFNHNSILKFCPKTRPFSNVEEMNEAIIKDWNSKVQPNHTIYNLGDFCFFRTKEEINQVLDRLKGKMVFIKGNHDRVELIECLKERNIPVHDYIEVKFNKLLICMSHFPYLEWHACQRGSIMCHGHTHSTINHLNVGTRRIDVGWDSLGGITDLQDVIDRVKMNPFTEHHGKID